MGTTCQAFLGRCCYCCSCMDFLRANDQGDIDEFVKKYQGGDEEKADLVEFYNRKVGWSF